MKQYCVNNHNTLRCGRDVTGRCAQCKNDYQAKYRKSKRWKNYHLRYGLEYYKKHRASYQWKARGVRKKDGSYVNTVDYDKMLDAQNGKCSICNKSEEVLCVDHNHQTGIVRGLLCGKCNKYLGFLENQDFVTKASAYLQRYSND